MRARRTLESYLFCHNSIQGGEFFSGDRIKSMLFRYRAFYPRILGQASTMMQTGMACSAERNQVLLRIVAGSATEFLVVNLKVRHLATRLASPIVPA